MAKEGLAVGLAGVAVAAVSLGLLVANWESLAQIDAWRVDVTRAGDEATQEGTTDANAAASDRVVEVTQSNVTRLSGVFTWQQRGVPPGGSIQVRLRVTDPQGQVWFDSARTGGGAQGFQFNFTLGDVPAERTYQESQEGAEGRFARDYAADTSATGVWTYSVEATGQGGLPEFDPGSVDWRLDVEWSYWQAQLIAATPPDFTGK